MKAIFIYNPVGGKGSIEKHKAFILSELKKKYEEVDIAATKCAGDMTKLAREAAEKYDAIIFAGGDGSVNEVVQGVADCPKPPVLGYIPSGTVNDVAHTLKIPKSIKKALKVIQTGRVEAIDCMKVNERYAVYVVTTGAFTSATYNTPQIQKNHIGRLAYGIEGLRHNLKFHSFKIACKGEEDSVQTEGCLLIAFINSKYVAGFKMNKRANLQDGEIEVAIIEHRKKNVFQKMVGYLGIAGLFLFGYRAKLRNVRYLKGKTFDVSLGEDVVWNIDGEKGVSGDIHIEVCQKRVKIIVPSK